MIQQLTPPGSVELSQRPRQHPDIRDGQVHSLRPGRRDNVRGVARQIQPSELHRLNHQAAHPRNTLLKNRPFVRPPSVIRREPRAEFFPDPRIRPLRDIFLRRALQIEPRDLGRPHAEQREPPFVIRVNQFFRRRRRLRQDSEPRERIHALVHAKCIFRDRRARDSMRAVAASHKITHQLLSTERDGWFRSVQTIQPNVTHLKVNLTPSVHPRLYQILDYFLLRIHRDRAPGSEVLKIDAIPLAAETQLDAVMHQPLFLQPRADARFHQQIHCALFQHAGAHAFLHVLARLRFENNRFDPFEMQQMRKHQPCRPRADYPDLGAHAFSISSFAI